MVEAFKERHGLKPPDTEPQWNFLRAMGSASKVSERRDSIYAFYSMVSTLQRRFTPTYDLQVWEVFAHTARAFIEESNSLDILDVCSRVRINIVEDGVPSWAPVWDDPMAKTGKISSATERAPFCASGVRQHVPRSREDARQLLVRGRVVETISEPIFSFGDEWDRQTQRRTCELISLDKVFEHLNVSYQGKENSITRVG
jgi:hypothetical protein